MGHCLRLLFLSCLGVIMRLPLGLGDRLVILNYRLRLDGGLVLYHGLRGRILLNNRLGLRSGLVMHYRLGLRSRVMMHNYMLRCGFMMDNHRLVSYYYRLAGYAASIVAQAHC